MRGKTATRVDSQPSLSRALFKAELVLGGETVPVKLYSAVTDHTVHFKMVDKKTHQPVTAQMVDTESEEVVPYDKTLRGFKDGDRYIVLHADELARLVPKASRAIEAVALVGPLALSSVWLDKPYYLGPDGDDDGYAAVTKALHTAKKQAMVHFVMRGHRYAGVVRSDGAILSLITLRHRGEVVAPGSLPKPTGAEPSARERTMAEQLVNAFEGEFDPSSYADDYSEKVRKLIDAKASGHAPRLRAPRTKRATESSLADALAQSLAQLGARQRQGTRAR